MAIHLFTCLCGWCKGFYRIDLPSKETLMRSIDIIALIVSALVALTITALSFRKSNVSIRPLGAFFMLFAPATIFVHMGCHIGEICLGAFENIKKGVFHYDFRFYSLMLMAVATLYCTSLLLQSMQRFFEGENYVIIIRPILMIFVVTAPTIPFTPIGALPLLSCLIALSALPFVRKKRKQTITRKYPRAARAIVKNSEALETLKFV